MLEALGCSVKGKWPNKIYLFPCQNTQFLF
jgi:hypothetical protein